MRIFHDLHSTPSASELGFVYHTERAFADPNSLGKISSCDSDFLKLILDIEVRFILLLRNKTTTTTLRNRKSRRNNMESEGWRDRKRTIAFVFYNGTIRSAGEFIWTIEKDREETWGKLTLHLVEIDDSPLRANSETRIVTTHQKNRPYTSVLEKKFT
jgi:hypothetical protein